VDRDDTEKALLAEELNLMEEDMEMYGSKLQDQAQVAVSTSGGQRGSIAKDLVDKVLPRCATQTALKRLATGRRIWSG
jgi:hypothetical protein